MDEERKRKVWRLTLLLAGSMGDVLKEAAAWSEIHFEDRQEELKSLRLRRERMDRVIMAAEDCRAEINRVIDILESEDRP